VRFVPLNAEGRYRAEPVDGMTPERAFDRTWALSLHWKGDPDLAGVRDTHALAKLPEAERAAWRALWSDAEGHLKRGEGRTP
jgi:hypothetical protein